ncbi:unnamed protein product [Eruca vesicaria subsp. sativa]|uniref:Uncharacterized protein n=1 Tax=Eruca vesicaria subsp. sativa TaxID=29727 RepID=A0ABC8JLK6_ERUVS|nr:unnamed protein product [Eruca vesicaria subsp. sativa]
MINLHFSLSLSTSDRRNAISHRQHLYCVNEIVIMVDLEESSAFQWTSGGRSDRDRWRSWNAEFFYGCCIASTKFRNAKAIARSDRYLAIATSGGLNQQRTGVFGGSSGLYPLNFGTLMTATLQWEGIPTYE